MSDKINPPNVGAVVSVRGSVVDIRFNKHLPPIYSLLRAGMEGQIAIEVLSQLDAHLVRGIALTSTQGLARGMVVEDTGGPLLAPVGKEFSRACSMFSETPSTASRRRLMSNGAQSIGLHRH
jgi:F-type H+-transporting ATPase subunit beta